MKKYTPEREFQELIDYWNGLSPLQKTIFHWRVCYWMKIRRHLPYGIILAITFAIFWVLLLVVVPVRGQLLELTAWCSVGAGVVLTKIL